MQHDDASPNAMPASGVFALAARRWYRVPADRERCLG
jgi:hypothetical protein